MSDNTPTFYIAIDDSGVLASDQNITVFAGLILPNNVVNNFLNNYEMLVKRFQKRSNYYRKLKELKHSNIRPMAQNAFFDYLKKHLLISVIINNNLIYPEILKNSKNRGRYIDYAIKMMIKNAIKEMINKNIINKDNDLKLIIYVDESSYKSNGYYNLKESIYNELKLGMGDAKNNIYFKGIIKGNLSVSLEYQKSHLSYFIQAADIIAGTIRKKVIKKESLAMVNYKIYLP